MLGHVLVLAALGFCERAHAQTPWTRPPPVLSGSAVRLIATGKVLAGSSFASGVDLLTNSYGLNVRQNSSQLLSVDMYYAGSDATRAAGILQGLAENDTVALWAARGGYGTTRLSDIVGFDASVLNTLSTSPRWLIGYSDVTALHALWNRAGVLSMHGPMGVDINSWSSNARSRLFEVLGGTGPIVQSYSGTIRYAGTPTTNVTGRLLGGNLSVLGSMVGSGYLPSYAGAILLIEDTDEAAYSVDRLLTQLLRAAEFQGIVGIAIGQLIGADTSSYTALELLDRTLSPLGIPVITGLSIGHTASTSLPIVLGAAAEINVALGKLVVSVP